MLGALDPYLLHLLLQSKLLGDWSGCFHESLFFIFWLVCTLFINAVCRFSPFVVSSSGVLCAELSGCELPLIRYRPHGLMLSEW